MKTKLITLILACTIASCVNIDPRVAKTIDIGLRLAESRGSVSEEDAKAAREAISIFVAPVPDPAPIEVTSGK